MDEEPRLTDEIRTRLQAVLAASPHLDGEPVEVMLLEGGLTNVNVKVVLPAQTVVVRLSSAEGSLLSIDRAAEHTSSLAAAASGAGPAVIDHLPEHRALVVEFLAGRTWTDADVDDPVNLARAAAACRRLHAGPRFERRFDMFEIQQQYLTIVRDRGFRMPERYLELLPQTDRLAAALAVRAPATVPCNNDLLAANFIDAGEHLWLIDFEYGGNNDPCFELGNIWSEATLPPDRLDVLVDAYYGTHLRHAVARARLLGLMSKYGWMLWASIQDAVSPLDFDFWAWGMQKYERALVELTSPELDTWLDEAARPD